MAGSASALREIRTRLGLSQTACAAALRVALETFRTWDAGRRSAPEAIVNRARTLKAKRPTHDRVPLRVLADELHVHVRTLRAAAHDGRLAATFDPRPFFGKLTATALATFCEFIVREPQQVGGGQRWIVFAEHHGCRRYISGTPPVDSPSARTPHRLDGIVATIDASWSARQRTLASRDLQLRS